MLMSEAASQAEPRPLPCRFRQTYCQFRPFPETQASRPALEVETRDLKVNDRATTPSASEYGSPAASSFFKSKSRAVSVPARVKMTSPTGPPDGGATTWALETSGR